MSFSFYWHDYETFGADPSRDWPCQFAGIRTDADLNIIGEPLEIFCKPPADYIPKPQACLVTGITPQQAWQKGLNEPEFIRRIHKELAQQDTCGVGYNSIRFDDEVTRYSLYRNFFDPYSREWQNGCSRWDIIDVVRMTYALRPEGIEWPLDDNGNPIFKLELLTKANGLAHEDAHDAVSDVKATIALAKLIKDQKPRLFDYTLKLRKKPAVLDVVRPDKPVPFVHVSSMFGAERGCLAVMVAVAAHPQNNNGVICFDLSQDPSEWMDASVEDIQRRVFTKADELEGESRLGFKTIHINKSPMVGTIKLLDDAAAERLGVDIEQCMRHYQQIQAFSPESFKRVREAMMPEAMPPRDVDQSLYGGFFDHNDKNLMTRIQQLEPQQLAGAEFAFTDNRLPDLFFRYKARHWPQLLSEAEIQRWMQHVEVKLTEASDNNPYVLDNYFADIEHLAYEHQQSESTLKLLERLQNYGEMLINGRLLGI